MEEEIILYRTEAGNNSDQGSCDQVNHTRGDSQTSYCESV